MSKVKEQLWQEPDLELDHTPDYEQDNNMHISKMSNSRYIKKDDVTTAVLVTISKVDQQNVAPDNETPEMKFVMHFSDFEKPLVLNQTNIALIAIALDSEDTDGWLNKQVVLYNDPSIMYAGKVTGGVRVRAPKQSTPAATATPADTPEFNDDVPF